jgi:anti-anti-sigma regulatory factor
MDIKTSTKEKFVVIYLNEEHITANMTAEIDNLGKYATVDAPHLIINLKEVNQIASEAAYKLAELQQQFYDKSKSFVFCEMRKTVEENFELVDLLDSLNTTPTESEAWDIVQMEEIERELLNDWDEN